MRNTGLAATRSAPLLDEDALVTILSRHFPGARSEVVRSAAEDVLLLDLLARDPNIVWEDAMQSDEREAGAGATLFDTGQRRFDS